MLDKLRNIEDRYDALEAEMASPDVVGDYQRLQALAKERSTLETLVSLARRLRSIEEQIEEARTIVNDGDDADLVRLAREELEALEPERERIEQDLRLALIPPDPHDERNVIVEIRGGTGGEEASLFAGDLYRMYARYAETRGWTVEVLSANETDRGGFKEVVFEIHGR